MEPHYEIDQPQPPSKLKKYLTYTISIILILLIISLVLSQIGTFEQFTANKIKDNQVKHRDTTITFENNSFEKLKEIYLESQPNEIKACLMGEQKDKEITINKIIIPGIIHQEFTKVISSPCPEDTIISLHSHPRKSCIFSEQDINNYKKQNIPLLGLLCDDNRLNFYP